MFYKSIINFLILTCLSVIPAYSAVYHINPEASSSGDGSVTSPFRRWSDLPKMSNGDDVYFLCGTNYSPSTYLEINWEGTERNPVIIGSYYLFEGKPIYGVSGKRPKISGSNYTVPENGYYGSHDSWVGLITINNGDYIRVRDLLLYRSGWDGIRINGDLNSGKNSAHFIIQNVKIEGAFHSGILSTNNKYNYGIIEGCEISGAAYDWKLGYNNDWPVILFSNNSPYANITIRKNYVYENWGEAIGSGRVSHWPITDHSGYALIEDNVVWNNRRVDIYISRTEHNTVRRNVLLGANDHQFRSITKDGRPWNQCGIWVNTETRQDDGRTSDVAHNNKIYNNFVAGHYTGIYFASGYEEGKSVNNFFYNNTAVGNYVNFTIGGNISNYSTQNIVFKNNISYCPPDTICRDVGNDPSWFDSKIEADHNAWTRKPSNWSGPNDKITNNYWVKTDGWQNLRSIPSISDLMPKHGNPVLGAGVYLPEPSNAGIVVNKSRYQTSPLNISVKTVQVDRSTSAGFDMGVLFVANGLPAPTISIVEVESN